MPIARTHADIFCLALYTLAGGDMLRGFTLATISDRLGISFGQAEVMAIAAAKAALVKLEFGTITLTGDGQTRAKMLAAPAFKTSAESSAPATRTAPPATPRSRRRA